MRLFLFLILLAIPFTEIAVFIQVGDAIGVWPTIALCLLTALAGSFLLRQQGLATLARARAQIDQGKMPVGEMLHGLALMLAGALLIVPGFVTDTVGLLLFLPAFRRFLMGGLLAGALKNGEVHVAGGGFPGTRPQGGKGTVIDGDYQDVTPPEPGAPDANSPWRHLPPGHEPDVDSKGDKK